MKNIYLRFKHAVLGIRHRYLGYQQVNSLCMLLVVNSGVTESLFGGGGDKGGGGRPSSGRG